MVCSYTGIMFLAFLFAYLNYHIETLPFTRIPDEFSRSSISAVITLWLETQYVNNRRSAVVPTRTQDRVLGTCEVHDT